MDTTQQQPATPANHTNNQPHTGIQGEANTPKPSVPLAPTPKLVVGAKTPTTQAPVDKVCWRSEDGLVVVKQLVKQAQKNPPSDYPCVVIQGFPQEHERVRRIPGGGIELMLTHPEAEAFVKALNAAAESQSKGQLYAILQSIPAKPKWRKEWWKKRNQARSSAQPRPSSGSWWRRRYNRY
jgi:hypothetical protein